VFFFTIPKKVFSFFLQNGTIKLHLFDKQQDAPKKNIFILLSKLALTSLSCRFKDFSADLKT